MQPQTATTGEPSFPARSRKAWPPSYHGNPDVSDLLPWDAFRKLFENGARLASDRKALEVLYPVMKISVPFDGPTWLLAAIETDGSNSVIAIIDDATGNVREGYVDFADIRAARGAAGFPAERCLHFEADADFAWYLERARTAGTLEF